MTVALELGGSGVQGQAAHARMASTTLLLMREGGGTRECSPSRVYVSRPGFLSQMDRLPSCTTRHDQR